MNSRAVLRLVVVLGGVGFANPVAAADTYAAVAANFTAAAKEIAVAFEKRTGNRVILSSGSTGQLHAQILNGAPFEIFLAADVEHPEALERDGVAVARARFTYAIGKLVLWSAKPDFVDSKGAVLKDGAFAKLAVANPKTAPYGTAALEALEKLGLKDAVAAKLVYGENIAQTHQFVATGAAAIGFVALAQVIGSEEGSRWMVPDGLYTPIRQQAVLVKKGEANPAAKAFFAFLKGPEAIAIINKFGYATDEPAS